jgi:AraC family transcriptional regulator of adaptative response/methylated-DNA-[protein]-cysteine methyltransferase
MRRSITERDPAADGTFVFGVRTTGVYCRPSCRSRPAKPQNIRFFLSPAEAEHAGFRPCKRCNPRKALDRAAHAMHGLARYIDQHADDALPLEHLAKRLKQGLKAGQRVLDSIADAGFQSTSRVYGEATRSLGMTPASYRAGGAGESIAYACRATALGPLMMAATDRGVCFAQFGASETALAAQLKAEFPRATLKPSRMAESKELDAWIRAFEAHIAGTAPRPDLPLDLRGTAFQIRVWRFLLQIPSGDLVSYSELAAGIGSPKAVRAAASACAANRIAVLVPCHRVLRGDGALGGYRWGLDLKRVLIDRERALSAEPIV